LDEGMSKQHNEGFLKLVNDAKKTIRELTIEQVVEMKKRGEKFHLIDVREESEWAGGRAQGAIYLGKGVIERDIETEIPNKDEPIVLYCGGGFRSALSAEALQKMGYTKVWSMDGGIRGWRERGLPEDRD
jgi:rhodanese-related sulfurtransferase